MDAQFWQTVIALVLVGLASLELVRRIVQFLKTTEDSACGSRCGSCSSNQPQRASSDNFIALDDLRRR